MMGDFGNSSEIDKDIDWAAFFASESNQESENYFDNASSSTSKGKNVMESSDSMMPEFTQSWNHTGTGWPVESPRAYGSSSLDFESMPYNPPYNPFVENPISQSPPIMPNSFEQQNNGISFNHNADSDLINNIYNWSPLVENDSETIIPAGPTQTSMVNPLEPNTSFFGNAPTTLAGPSNNPVMEQQRFFNNQQSELNDTRNNGPNYLQNQPYSSYFLSNLNNCNRVTTPMNPTNPNDTPRFFNQSPPVNNHVVAPWNTQQVAEPISDFNLTRSQSPQPLLGENPKPITNELQKYNALNFQQGHRTIPILQSMQLRRQMNAGHSSTPNTSLQFRRQMNAGHSSTLNTFDYRRSLLNQGNKDTSLFHGTSLQTNQDSTDIQSPSQLLMRKLFDPRFQEKNEQSVFQQTSKLVDSLKLKGDSNFPKYDSARYNQKGPWSPLVNQTFAPNYKINEQMQANPTEKLEIPNNLDFVKFDPLEDTCLTADGDVDDPWLDQCYTQIQTIKKKYLIHLKMSLTTYDLRAIGSGLSRNEKSEALELRKMINFLCMPIAEMKTLSLRDFAHTKRQIANAYDKIMAKVPQPMLQNSQLLSTLARSQPDLTRPPTPSISALSIGRKVTSSWRESLAPKLAAPKKRKMDPVSNHKLSNESKDKQQQASAANDAQVGVQIPGPPHALANHQVQNPHNLTREQETVQNQVQNPVGVQIPGPPNSLANHQVQNLHNLTREQETVQNQVGVQIPGPPYSLANHQVQNPHNLTKEHEPVQNQCQNQVGVQIPGTPNSLANQQVQNPHNLTRQQETVQNQDLGQPSVQNQGPQLYTGPRLSLLKPSIIPSQSLWSNLDRQNNQKPSLLGESPLLRTQALNESPVPNNAAFSRPVINNNIRIHTAARIAKEVRESEFCYAIGPNDDTVPENMPDLLSKELKNKMKRLIDNATTVRSSLAKKKNEAAIKLLKEIQFINQNFADIKMEVDSSEDGDETYNVDGIVLVCSYRASSSTPQHSSRIPMPLHVFPVLKLRLIVPPAYPELSPDFVVPSSNQPSQLYEILIKKAYKLLFKCCRNLLTPMSLDGIATAWQASARAVTMEFGRDLGQGTFNASDNS